MDKKYIIDTQENRAFLQENVKSLLEFGKNFPSPGGSSYYLGDDGSPWTDRNRETWITSRMVHVYSIGKMLRFKGCGDLAGQGLKGLSTELRDVKNGGWYAGLTKDGAHLPSKQCYAHAFVILAASSAYLAGIDGAKELLNEAINLYDKRFWDEKEGLSVDTWNTEFTELDTYRGLNANMHTVEAFLAVADCLKIVKSPVKSSSETEADLLRSSDSEKYRKRAGRIISRVVKWAEENNYRLPEHFTSDWVAELDKNKDKPDDPFKPYGATPGHGIEWARLITQWTKSTETLFNEEKIYYINTACALYERAVADAWNADGAEGIVYTTDWNGKPVVHDRMHWTLAEAINTSAVLYRVTGKKKYSDDYSMFLKYLDEKVLDHSTGSWFHQLDEKNNLKGTVWPGKSDLYHAFQSMLIPYNNIGLSIASAVKSSL